MFLLWDYQIDDFFFFLNLVSSSFLSNISARVVRQIELAAANRTVSAAFKSAKGESIVQCAHESDRKYLWIPFDYERKEGRSVENAFFDASFMAGHTSRVLFDLRFSIFSHLRPVKTDCEDGRTNSLRNIFVFS